MRNFKAVLQAILSDFDIQLDGTAIDRLVRYDELLIQWNQNINLTALTEPADVALKHFADSLMLLKYTDIPMGTDMIDVGTGAGFPGLVLKVARPDIRLTLLDSLNKRLLFLEEVCAQLGIEDVAFVHCRAEEGARTALRDSFDIAVSRAVAPLNILCEYDMPYVKPGGRMIAMKGKDADGELAAAQGAIDRLCGTVKAQHRFTLGAAGERRIIEIVKTAPTPPAYPRRSKAIKSKPL